MNLQTQTQRIIVNEKTNIATAKYYRLFYKDDGIYNSLKQAVGYKWKDIREDKAINWLPLPTLTEYKPTYRSYFTTKGYETFKTKAMSLVTKHLNSKDITIRSYDKLNGKIVYQDEFQVVVDTASK